MSRLLALSVLVVSAPFTLAQTTAPGRTGADPVRSPFRAQAAQGAEGTLRLAFEPAAHAALAPVHARGAAFTLEDWPLPGGRLTRAHLRPVSAFEPDARARVIGEDGSVSWLAPSVLCFSGGLEEGGELFFGLTESELHGYFRSGGELHFLSSGGGPAGEAWLTPGRALPPSGNTPLVCATPSGPRVDRTGEDAGRQLVTVPRLKTASVFIEADPAFRALFPSDQACVDYSALLVAATSEVYRRDLGARLAIPNGYLRVWNTTPPWGVITGFGDIDDVRNWWVSFANPDRALARAAVHVFTAPVFGGVAYNIGGLCTSTSGYEISSLYGHFPSPRVHTHSDNWDLFVVAHEFGHTFGCEHSFDFQPPIQCQDGSGPDQGTLMSYCHLTFGVGGVGMRFHVREQREIREHLTFVSCLAEQTLQSGDYDADGAADPDDLVAANTILAQGFRSLGAEDVLDLDGDADFDATDRDLLAATLAAPPARVVFRNGRGWNEECLLVSGNPVLGRTWTPRIFAAPAGRLTQLFFFDLPHAGLRTPYGELLVLPPHLGGRQIYAATAPSNGFQAEYPLNLPVSVGLVGLETAMQGIVLGAPGTRLCNAYDVVLSTYE